MNFLTDAQMERTNARVFSKGPSFYAVCDHPGCTFLTRPLGLEEAIRAAVDHPKHEASESKETPS